MANAGSGFQPLVWSAKLFPMPRTAAVFPEQSLKSWPPPGTTDTGICFSGGGNRAMSAAMGQMRGLRSLGLLGKARYMSCVSGGSWAGTIFTFVPASTNDDILLGKYLAPEKIISKSQVAAPLDPGCMCEPATTSLSDVMEQFWGIVPDNQLWLRSIGYHFLRPIGGGRWGLNDVIRPFTWNQETLQSILSRNGNQWKSGFYTVEERSGANTRRPFLIDMTTLIWKPSDIFPRDYMLPVEFTPYYCGLPGHYTRTYDGYDLDVGGGYVESFAFGRQLYSRQPPSGDVVWTKRSIRPFVLSDMTGTSSAFYANVAADLDLGGTWDPAYNYYPIPLNGSAPNGQATQLTGDGGVFDNTGILPLLIRRLSNIISFVNCDSAISWSDIHQVPIVDEMLPPLFGYQPYSLLHSGGYELYPSNSTDPWALLKVFKSDQFLHLINALWKAAQSGQTAMDKRPLQIDPTNKLGIDYAGGAPNVLWVYNNPVSDWTDSIASPEVKADVKQGEAGGGPLAYFPNYSTGFEDFEIWNPSTWGTLAGLSAYQVTMLADLSHWNITSNQAAFNAMF